MKMTSLMSTFIAPSLKLVIEAVSLSIPVSRKS